MPRLCPLESQFGVGKCHSCCKDIFAGSSSGHWELELEGATTCTKEVNAIHQQVCDALAEMIQGQIMNIFVSIAGV